MKLRNVLTDAKKALAAFAAVESEAVALGIIDKPVAAWITVGVGVATSIVVYLIDNESTIEKL